MLSDDEAEAVFAQFMKTKAAVDHGTKRMAQMKADLMEFAEATGLLDDKGHRWVAFDSGGRFRRQRAETMKLNVERVREWLEEVGRTKEVFKKKIVEVLDEDALFSVADDEELTGEQIDAFYDITETYSFHPEV